MKLSDLKEYFFHANKDLLSNEDYERHMTYYFYIHYIIWLIITLILLIIFKHPAMTIFLIVFPYFIDMDLINLSETINFYIFLSKNKYFKLSILITILINFIVYFLFRNKIFF